MADFAQWLWQPDKLDAMLDSDNKHDSASNKDVSIGDAALEEGDSESEEEQDIFSCKFRQNALFSNKHQATFLHPAPIQHSHKQWQSWKKFSCAVAAETCLVLILTWHATYLLRQNGLI